MIAMAHMMPYMKIIEAQCFKQLPHFIIDPGRKANINASKNTLKFAADLRQITKPGKDFEKDKYLSIDGNILPHWYFMI
jgi:hypothetical protein